MGGHYRNARIELKSATAAKTSIAAPPAASAAASHQLRRYRPASVNTPAKQTTQLIVPTNTPAHTSGSPPRPAAPADPAIAGTATNQNASVIGLSSVMSSPAAYARPAPRCAAARPDVTPAVAGPAAAPIGSERHASR